MISAAPWAKHTVICKIGTQFRAACSNHAGTGGSAFMSLNLDEQLVASISIAPTVDEIPHVNAWLETLAEAEDWAMRARFGLELSLEEALVNIITHGFKATRVTPMIRVDYLHRADGRGAFRIVDNGIAFDPTIASPPALAANLDEARIGGHGLRLMRHYLSDLNYTRVGDENRLTLIAHLKAGEPSA